MKCLIDGCNVAGKIRGLCPICYQAAAATIKLNRTTWVELEDMGLANKAQHKPSGHGAFARAFRKQLGPLSGDIFDGDKETGTYSDSAALVKRRGIMTCSEEVENGK